MKYTREQLEAMPDRELDAVVATVVMGYCPPSPISSGEEITPERIRQLWGSRPPYSTDIAAAWEVIERFGFVDMGRWSDEKDRSIKFYISLGRFGNKKPRRNWPGEHDPVVVFVPEHTKTAFRAICIAAVLAVQEANK